MYFPYLPFWGGDVVLATSGDSQNGTAVAQYFGDLMPSTGEIISESFSAPKVFLNYCSGTSIFSATFTSCLAWDSSQNTVLPGATLLQDGPEGGAQAAQINTKGRLIFEASGDGEPTHSIITLIDVNRPKTTSTANQRPSWDANDTMIGVDQMTGNDPNTTGLAFGAPVSISNYIGTVLDNSSWLERLTSSLKSFKVPIATSSYFDVSEIASPGNPSASTDRVYADSTSHVIKCLTSAGGNCLLGTSPAGAANSVQAL